MASTDRTLTQRGLNRALLARQMLLERARVQLPRALERMGGLQAQYAPSMYIGLWSRVADFERDDLTRALERKSVVQGTLMRATIHLVSRRDYWPFAVAIGDGRREWWLRVQLDRSLTARDMAAAARRLRARLAHGPMHRTDVEKAVGKDRARGVGLWLDLVRVPPAGTWDRRRADLFALAEEWLGPPEVERDEGIELLVRRYLGAFGPALAAEIADWAGLSAADVQRGLARIRVRRFRDERGKELLDLPRARLPDPETLAPVRFLPTWDASLLTHARRTQILPERHRPKVFSTKTPQSVGTFLVDGAVAGAWRHEGGRIRLDPFEHLDRTTRRELNDEADRLTALHM
jgi:hypothetical protein